MSKVICRLYGYNKVVRMYRVPGIPRYIFNGLRYQQDTSTNLLSYFYGFVGDKNDSLLFENWVQERTLMILVALLSIDIRDNTVRLIGNVSLPEKYTTLRISVYDIPGKNGGLTYHFKRRIIPQRITITSCQTPLWG